MNVNAGHERTSKARIIHRIQLIRGITRECTRKSGTRSLYRSGRATGQDGAPTPGYGCMSRSTREPAVAG
ncbi:hypothetical protein [Shigella dysenteriae]|uniref:hypothetical protein n=1 Tax=Shigella dysenteriae TaxID=622 RepID=UPI001493C184|nr:hypothetical protein [Shigella dysenteriae]